MKNLGIYSVFIRGAEKCISTTVYRDKQGYYILYLGHRRNLEKDKLGTFITVK